MITQIINGDILIPSGLKKSSIEIENGIIQNISNKTYKSKSIQTIDATGKYILPGFIDLHTNGIAGFDLTNGLYNAQKSSFVSNKKDYLHGFEKSLETYALHGTTLVGFTILEASIAKLKRIFSYIADYKNKSNSQFKDIFHGIYMEGTFMKDKAFKGAHNPKYFFEPSIKLFNELESAADRNIKLVNVVPEWGDKAIKFIEFLTKKNILCAAGHTSARGVEYNKAIKKGLRLAIHVLNGPSSSSFKPFDNGGALESLLRSDEIFVEIIPDGYHVDKSYLLDIIKRKGIDKTIAISDSMFVTSTKKIKEFSINGVMGKVSKNGKYIHIAGEENINSLFGSSLTMDKAFENLINWFTQPIEGIWNKLHKESKFEEALISASKMCSANPSTILNIKKNSVNEGSIETGKRANLVIADISKKNQNYKLKINKVLLNGNIVVNQGLIKRRT